jgi:hypothetical protein
VLAGSFLKLASAGFLLNALRQWLREFIFTFSLVPVVVFKSVSFAFKGFVMFSKFHKPNKALKAVRVAHWTSFNSAFASQIICAVSSRPLALRYASH